MVALKMGLLRFRRWMEPVLWHDDFSLNSWTWVLKLISGKVGEPHNQMQKEILRNYECGLKYLMQYHHHQKGQVSCQGPGPIGLGGANSISSFIISIPLDLVHYGQYISWWKNLILIIFGKKYFCSFLLPARLDLKLFWGNLNNLVTVWATITRF